MEPLRFFETQEPRSKSPDGYSNGAAVKSSVNQKLCHERKKNLQLGDTLI